MFCIFVNSWNRFEYRVMVSVDEIDNPMAHFTFDMNNNNDPDLYIWDYFESKTERRKRRIKKICE